MLTLSKLKKKLKGIGCYYPANGKFDRICELFLAQLATEIEENIKISSAFWALQFSIYEENTPNDKRFGLLYTTNNIVEFFSTSIDKTEIPSHQQFDFKKITDSKISDEDNEDNTEIRFTYDGKKLIFMAIDKDIPKTVFKVFMAHAAESMFSDKTKMRELLAIAQMMKDKEELGDIEEVKSNILKQFKI